MQGLGYVRWMQRIFPLDTYTFFPLLNELILRSNILLSKPQFLEIIDREK